MEKRATNLFKLESGKGVGPAHSRSLATRCPLYMKGKRARKQATTSTSYNMITTTNLIRVCAWCGLHLSPVNTFNSVEVTRQNFPSKQEITHGICQKCKEKHFKKYSK
jgi:hypothetical protein